MRGDEAKTLDQYFLPMQVAAKTSQSAIVVRDVWMSFPGKEPREQIHVLEHVSLEVKEGEFVCIVGPSGCANRPCLISLAAFSNAPGRCHRRRPAGRRSRPTARLRLPGERRVSLAYGAGEYWIWLLKKSAVDRAQIVAHYIDMVGLHGFERAYRASFPAA